MALEMGLWRADGSKLERIEPTSIGLESQLETYIESDPTMLGTSLLLIGRQVPTAHGGYVDLLAVDETGTVHVLELKRDKTPRDVTAQALDYGSWVSTLSRGDIVAIWNSYKPHKPFEVAFAEAFGDAPPEDLNTSQVFTIVAATVDAATERIVRFLNEGYGIPINVVFFRHFEDGGNRYLARTWLVDHEMQPTKSGSSGKQVKSKEPWNGQDWYCSFGDDGTSRNWVDAATHGFVSAGGQSWYSRTLKNLPVGGRVFACIPGSGYVGVGTVTGTATRFDQLKIDTGDGPIFLASLPLLGNYTRPGDEDDEIAEWAVPIEWTHTVPKAKAVWQKGMFANQNSVAKLRQAFTIEQVSTAFNLDD
ncbi:DUF91 domain-containing protein [Nocardioides sp. Y6]|uniref:DUF91 domain-containing protein n=1 Tax=Nocardioides malaquae TaxID=2773426 RepID=A0ABR9RWX2_9ACTN|nr:endonuclease NucS [Nocardioides malaquae]MBE7326041.1 DUF91 domain-containing protein [Nocardioides malaquae]